MNIGECVFLCLCVCIYTKDEVHIISEKLRRKLYQLSVTGHSNLPQTDAELTCMGYCATC